MQLNALLFGSIGTLVETSDLQRRAFNRAFEEDGLGWEWDVPTYRSLLTTSGGVNRILTYASQVNDTVEPDAARRLHRRKTEIFIDGIATDPLDLRPGVARLIDDARLRKIPVALVSTTETATIDAIFTRFDDAIPRNHFDAVFDRTQVENGKPDPEVYRKALAALGVAPAAAMAIEDTAVSAQAAIAAGVTFIATPGALAPEQDFEGAAAVVSSLGTPAIPCQVLRTDVELATHMVTLEWLDALLAQAA